MSNVIVQESIVSAEEVQALLANLEMAVDGYQREAIVVALVSLACIIQYPSINEFILRDVVRDVTRFMCLVMDQSPVDPKKAN